YNGTKFRKTWIPNEMSSMEKREIRTAGFFRAWPNFIHTLVIGGGFAALLSPFVVDPVLMLVVDASSLLANCELELGVVVRMEEVWRSSGIPTAATAPATKIMSAERTNVH